MAGHGAFPIGKRIVAPAAGPTFPTFPGPILFPVSGGNSQLKVLFPIDKITTRVEFGNGPNKKPLRADDMKGFRHLLPTESVRVSFKVDGQDPHKDQPTTDRLRRLMSRLAKSFDCEFPWRDHSAGAKTKYPDLMIWENPEIPAGYTYLLQLVAHDLVATSFPLSILEDTRTGARNTRSAALRLDTIYGGGPEVCPFAYAFRDASDNVRMVLRLGPMQDEAGAPGKLRDIVRTVAPSDNGDKRPGLSEIAIADPRNDDNAVISQMTTLFHMLHNTILDLMPPHTDLNSNIADSIPEAAMDRFFCARAAVTLIYRRIIRDDLLKKILHPAVYDFYTKRPPGFEFLDKGTELPSGDARMPLEFSHAVFRFGHAMVRPGYRFNERKCIDFDLRDVLKQNSANLPTKMPLNRDWIARWSYFFELNDTRPNLSRRIGPEFSREFIHPKVFPNIDEVEKQAGLAYRDLLVGGFLELWSVPALVEIVKKRRPNLYEKSKLLSGDYKGALREYLTARRYACEFGDNPSDIDSLVNDPPLAFFVLWEAAADPETRGLRLGLLGSIIVADVIFAAMMRDTLPGEDSSASLKDALAAFSKHTHTKNYLTDLEEIGTMKQLIEFVARRKKLENEEPGFI